MAKGAQRIRIALAESPDSSPLDMSPAGRRRILEAKLIGGIVPVSTGRTVLLQVLRGARKLSLTIPAAQHHDTEDNLADLIDPQNRIGPLGVFVYDLDDKIRDAVPDIGTDPGVVVVAQSAELNSYTSSFQARDILRSLNEKPIESVEQLRPTLHDIKPGQAVVLQIERV
ncbi:MAG TPA: hypothetical protein VHZ55_26265 [Bryobacteraceae bacterium]|nr:hypothetical protein [Bryobacteraceae bacterium]